MIKILNHLSIPFIILFILFFVSNLFAEIECDNGLADDLLGEYMDVVDMLQDPFEDKCNAFCPQGYTDVDLYARESTYKKSSFETLMKQREIGLKMKGKPDFENRTLIFRDGDSLAKGIFNLNKSCVRVKRLTVYSGVQEPGFISRKDSSMQDLVPLKPFAGISCAFAEGAEIHLAGTKVAKGSRGYEFMNELGRLMLSLRGGIVTTIGENKVAITPLELRSQRF